VLFAAVFAAAFHTPVATALDPNLTWRTLEGPHFKVSYHADEQALAEQVLDVAEAATTSSST